jgi:hypothetical protein
VEIEGDQHVVSYKWESPIFEGIHPNYYHIWHCAFCNFCDEKEVFRGEDDSGGKLELIREKLLIASKAPKSFINRMGGTIDMEQEYVTLEAALCSHLQAIYIQKILTPNMRQYAKLGRLYLRTAWLYREKTAWDMPYGSAPVGYASYDEFFLKLAVEWPELPLDENVCIDSAIEFYREALDRSKRVDDARYEIGVTFLLADLHLRRERLDDAAICIRHVFQNATSKRQGTRTALDGGISRGKLNEKQIESMRSLITWLNNAIERSKLFSDKINNMIFEKEYPSAREKLLNVQGLTVKGILELLKTEGFHDVTCKRVAAMFSRKLLEKKGQQQPEEEIPPPTASEDELGGEDEGGGFLGSLFGRFKKS